MLVIDAMGKACPIPVIMAKKEIDGGKSEFIVTVDNKIAVENLKKLATSQGFGLFMFLLQRDARRVKKYWKNMKPKKKWDKVERKKTTPYSLEKIILEKGITH